MINYNSINLFFTQAAQKKILIFGDIMLDSYLLGNTKRISPEAPVPILHFQSEEFRLGGAGNVAVNLAKQKVKTFLASVISERGEDRKLLINLLKKKKINTQFIIGEKGRITSKKTRVVSGNQQIVRIDKEDLNKIKDETIKKLIEKIKKTKIKFDAIIFSDYGKGVICPTSFKLLLKFAHKNKIFTALDPKQRNFSFYNKINLMTPNHFEAQEAINLPNQTDQEVERLGKKVLKKFKLKYLIITRGKKGMMIFNLLANRIKITSFPSFNRNLYDVSGAGDTVVAMVVLSFLIYGNIFQAAFLANICAGVVVSKFGVAYPEKNEIINELKRLAIQKND